jgi:hypothetical protein
MHAAAASASAVLTAGVPVLPVPGRGAIAARATTAKRPASADSGDGSWKAHTLNSGAAAPAC